MYMVVSFLGVQFKLKHFRENENNLIENFLNGQSPYGLKHVIITFYHWGGGRGGGVSVVCCAPSLRGAVLLPNTKQLRDSKRKW